MRRLLGGPEADPIPEDEGVEGAVAEVSSLGSGRCGLSGWSMMSFLLVRESMDARIGARGREKGGGVAGEGSG